MQRNRNYTHTSVYPTYILHSSVAISVLLHSEESFPVAHIQTNQSVHSSHLSLLAVQYLNSQRFRVNFRTTASQALSYFHTSFIYHHIPHNVSFMKTPQISISYKSSSQKAYLLSFWFLLFLLLFNRSFIIICFFFLLFCFLLFNWLFNSLCLKRQLEVRNV